MQRFFDFFPSYIIGWFWPKKVPLKTYAMTTHKPTPSPPLSSTFLTFLAHNQELFWTQKASQKLKTNSIWDPYPAYPPLPFFSKTHLIINQKSRKNAQYYRRIDNKKKLFSSKSQLIIGKKIKKTADIIDVIWGGKHILGQNH